LKWIEIDQDNLRIGTAKAVANLMSFAQITCLGHIELGQCRKCNYSLKRIQNFRLFNFVRQAVSEQHGLGEGLRAMTAF